MSAKKKFKEGDKIRRIIQPYNNCKVGKIYTVKGYAGLGVTLVEVSGGYDTDYFELIPNDFFNEELFTL